MRCLWAGPGDLTQRYRLPPAAIDRTQGCRQGQGTRQRLLGLRLSGRKLGLDEDSGVGGRNLLLEHSRGKMFFSDCPGGWGGVGSMGLCCPLSSHCTYTRPGSDPQWCDLALSHKSLSQSQLAQEPRALGQSLENAKESQPQQGVPGSGTLKSSGLASEIRARRLRETEDAETGARLPASHKSASQAPRSAHSLSPQPQALAMYARG